MKKLLILILIGLLLTLSIYVVLNGLTIGSVEILSITGIQDGNAKLDEKIQEAGKLANKDFQQAVSSVQDNAKQLETKKTQYEDMIVISGDEEGQPATQIQKYEIETLWVRVGNYATKEGTVMKMDVSKGSNNTSETYNLKFTVNGSYIGIEDFISDIENDSSLGFKIEEFKMAPSSSGSDLEATFVCNDIYIKGVNGTSPVTSNTNTNNTTNTTNTNNTTNTTNTNSTNNTTNTNNATNATNNTNVAK